MLLNENQVLLIKYLSQYCLSSSQTLVLPESSVPFPQSENEACLSRYFIIILSSDFSSK